MKKICLFLLFTTLSFGQFKDELNKPLDLKSGMMNKSGNFSIMGMLGIEDFQMHHTLGLSYTTFAGSGFSLGTYTNSMTFKFNDRINLLADISLITSPYSSFGKEFTNQVNGIYIDRIQMNYKISKSMNFTVQYSNSPYKYFSNYFLNRFWGDSFFLTDHLGKE